MLMILSGLSHTFHRLQGRLILSAALLFLLFSSGVSELAHNHKFDGHEHHDCPVYYFTTVTSSGQIDVPDLEIITEVSYYIVYESRQSERLSSDQSPLPQRAPPA